VQIIWHKFAFQGSQELANNLHSCKVRGRGGGWNIRIIGEDVARRLSKFVLIKPKRSL